MFHLAENVFDCIRSWIVGNAVQYFVATETNPTANDYLYKIVKNSWEVDKLDTLKILVNWRDCRGGKGDYTGFIVAIAYLYQLDPEWINVNLSVIPEYGRWLDLIQLWHICEEGKDQIMNTIIKQLNIDQTTEKVSQLAKWIPSENGLWDRFTKDRFCIAMCKTMFNVTIVEREHLKKLRKEYIVPLRAKLSLIETKMCENKFQDIDYEHVPSVAMNKLNKAFMRNDKTRFEEYLTKVGKGKAKINSAQVYPHDLVHKYMIYGHEDLVIEAQWKEIKKKTCAFKHSISVVDVSSSMQGTPMEVAIALGLLGLCNNKVITFSANPKLHDIPDGSLLSQVTNIKNMDWGGNTNFELVMNLVLDLVISGTKINQVFVFSDMQFDKAMVNGDATHYNIIKLKFKEQGVQMPSIVFWNLRGDTNDFSVTCDENGVVMLSGYSPSLLNIMEMEEITPLSMMLKIIRGPRYDAVKAP